MTWTQTRSGAAVSFLAPDPAQIHLADIAVSLARCGRFNRATKHHYSVAQHCLVVERIVTEAHPHNVPARLWALLHDAHEAYTGDLITPLLRAIDAMIPAFTANPIRGIQQKLDDAILASLGIDPADIMPVRTIVHRADAVALSTEKRQLYEHTLEWGIALLPPADFEILPISAAAAEFVWNYNIDKALTDYRAWKAQPAVPSASVAAE